MIVRSCGSSTAAAVSVKAVPSLYSLVRLGLSRLYSTAGAALPQLDPGYYYNDYNERDDRFGKAPMTDEAVWFPVRGVQWAFIGCPHAKKSVFAETLSKLLDVPHISMVSLVRQELNPRSSIYKQIANAVNRRELVPEDIIFGLLSKRLEDGYHRGETGFILDGIPRSHLQAEILDQLAEIDLVVNFKCPKDFLAKYQQDATLKDKLNAYITQHKSLEDYYQKQEKLLDFQVGRAPGETWRGLLAALHLQHLNAVHSSKKLTAASKLF